MTPSIADVSLPARVAEPGEGISHDELRLASRNHAMPLELLRDDVTPVGLHYVLAHFDLPALDPQTWQLTLDGEVERELRLGLAALQSRPTRTVRLTMECAGNGRAALEPRPVSQPWLNGAVGTADWTGVPLADLLDEAGVSPSAVEVVFTGADRGFERGVEQDYQRGLPLTEAHSSDVLVAYAMNGSPLPVQHGFPVRLVVPGWYGMAHVKWLTGIRLIDHTFEGFQNVVAYRLRQEADEPGVPVTRIEPRALLLPPGLPDFMTRDRVARPGVIPLQGRAWSGWGPISGVEVSTDGGASWTDARLEAAGHRWAWQGFTMDWDARPGVHELCVRAHDATGRAQGAGPQWNRGGFANNGDQPLRVVVLEYPAG